MRDYLLDSNVVSELTRDAPNPRVVAFLSGHAELWLSAIVVHELEFGLALLPPGRRREAIDAALRSLEALYEDRILALGRAEAARAAALRARARRSGRVLDLGAALIAGTADAHGLAVATRNVRDFEGLGLDLADPWAGG
ncbi:MAG: PIN domain-containing protein [Defluviicoccus sp.]|nr:PIN domain-containing protein [Defluviicoccus sp.]MDE0386134.1 PIN domain-containing protein [Defluviicoccus sp.]